MKRYFSPKYLIAIAMIALLLPGVNILARPSDNYLKSRVVKLYSSQGSCSGEQIKAPSGVSYILTAAHCRVLEENGSIKVETEDGRKLERRVLAEDEASDLLLLEGLPNMDGLPVAKKTYAAQHVRTFTHGRGLPTYRTDGVLIADRRISVPLYMISNDAEAERCTSQSKSKVLNLGFFGSYCILDVVETFTTAMILPGSSGGLVVSDAGELTGVVSAGDGVIGCLVTIEDIHHFIDNY